MKVVWPSESPPMTPSFKGFHGAGMPDLNSMASMLEFGLIEDGTQDIVRVAMTMAAIAQK